MSPSDYCRNCGRQVHSSRGPYCEPCGHMPAPSTLTDSDALTDGAWVQHGATKRWVPSEQHPVTRRQYRALMAERYAAPTWFAKPATPDDQIAGRRRLAECVREAEQQGHEREAS